MAPIRSFINPLFSASEGWESTLVPGAETGLSTLPLSVPAGASPLALGPTTLRPVLAEGRFVAGAENLLLRAVLQRLCGLLDQPFENGSEEWGHLVSPLVVVAPTGCGKTHLAEGLARMGGPQAQFTTAADLRRDFAEAIDQGTTRRWRDRWARQTLLVIDDIDHMAPGVAFQHELRCLIDEIHARGHKLIVTSARPIAHLRGWSAELVDRFAAGLTLEVSPLEATTRREVLRQVVERQVWCVDAATLELMATHAPDKPRDLIAWIGRLQQHFPPRGKLSTSGVEEFVRQLKAKAAPDLPEIVRMVSRYYGIPQKVLVSASRQASAVAARGMVVYLARQLTTASYEQIAQRLGGRDHTTIMHNYQRTCQRLASEPALRQACDELQTLLRR